MRNRDALPGPDTPYRRRTLLRAGAGLASLAAIGTLSGCQDAPVIGGGDGADVVDDVPAESQFLLHAEVGSILENQQLRESVNTLLSDGEVPAEAASLTELLDEAENEFDLDPRQAETLTLFGAIPESLGERFWGAILSTSWSDQQLETIIGDRTGVGEPGSYEGTTVFKLSEQPTLWFALPGDGELIVGNEAATRSVIDLRAGDGAAVSGELRENFTATEEGYVRFAGDVPTEQLSPEDREPVLAGIVVDVQSFYGSVARGGDRSLTSTFELIDADSATRLEEDLSQIVDTTRQQVRDAETQFSRELEQDLVTVLEDTTVTRSGSAVTLTVPKGLEVVAVGLLASIASFVLGFGSRPDPTPAVSFAFDYDEGERRLRITHNAGDTVQAAALSIRGTGFASDHVDWLEAGGSTSSEIDGQPAVTAGDAVTLRDVAPDYEVLLIWESLESDRSAALAEDRGPDA